MYKQYRSTALYKYKYVSSLYQHWLWEMFIFLNLHSSEKRRYEIVILCHDEDEDTLLNCLTDCDIAAWSDVPSVQPSRVGQQ